jgi:hypothetical protein
MDQKTLCVTWAVSHRDIAGSHHGHGDVGEVPLLGGKVSALVDQIELFQGDFAS